MLSMEDIDEITELDLKSALVHAHEAAAMADEIMMRSYRGDYATYTKPGARGRAEAVVTQPDLECDEALVAFIEEHYPDTVVVSEESYENLAPDWHENEWIWYVDPIDGSLSYLEGSDSFGVSIGLVHKGEPVLGIITNPALGWTAAGLVGEGAWFNGKEIAFEQPHQTPPQLLLSVGQNNSRSYRLAFEFLDNGAPLLRRSVVTKTLMILRQDADYYFSLPYDVFHGGRPNAWDLAGGAAVVAAAGGAAVDMYGQPFSFVDGTLKWSRGHIFAHPGVLPLVHGSLLEAVEKRKELDW